MKVLRWILSLISLMAMAWLLVMPTTLMALLFGWMPKVQLAPAMLAGEIVTVAILIFVTLLFGRVYCAVMCPLGIAQDLARLVLGWVPLKRCAISRWVAYVALVASVIGVGCGFAALIEPYGIFGRFLTMGVRRFGDPAMAMVVWSLTLFTLILVMTMWRARWWCNQICPVGTLLGFFSRYALFRARIDREQCIGCGVCARACEAGAIVIKEGKAQVNGSFCVMCMRCKRVCNHHSLTFSPRGVFDARGKKKYNSQ